MKVGILTFHHGRNHGGFLQTVALQRAVSELGYQCYVINYVNFHHYWAELKMHWNPLRARFGYAMKWLRFSKNLRKVPQTRLILRKDQLEKLSLDVVIVGSDEVWNFNNSLFGTDLTFFGLGFKNCKKIAFAASFGATNSSFEIPNEINQHIRDFQQVSVRDINSKMIVEAIFERDVPLSLDPAFLHSFQGMEQPCHEQDFILVYTTGLRPLQIEQVKLFAQEKNLKTISVGYYNKWCDVNVVSCDPFAWLGYFKVAHSVVTTMFHGTIYSIIYQKNFCTFMTPYRQNKFDPMLENLNVADRIGSDHRSLKEIMQKPPDYEQINMRINAQVGRSIEYLKMAIGEPAMTK